MGRVKRIVAMSLVSLMTILMVPKVSVQAIEGNYYNKIYEYGSKYLSDSIFYEEREDLRLSLEGNKNFRSLQTKTDSNYEIALAYSDGNYSYLDKADTYDEALSKCNSLSDSKTTSATMPVIIDKSGQVVYAERSVGRVRKYMDGVAIENNNYNSNVYTSSSMSGAHTYVNHGYISEVPLIRTSGNAAEVLIGGYRGWMSYRNNNNLQNSDIVVWPLVQVTNPSYYEVVNGVLVHYISMSLDTPGNGVKLNVGVAPDFLKEGKKYVSYDGEYFYDGTNPQDGIWNVTLDLQEGTKKRAINSNNPYYVYNTNLSFRSKSNYTAAQIDSYIDSVIASNPNKYGNSKLKGLGSAFKEGEEKYGVNAILALGVAINESNWGISRIAQEKNNLFGINAVDATPGESANYFKTPRDCVLQFAQDLISNQYLNPRDWKSYGTHLGNKELGLNVKYASDPFWGEKAASHAFNLDYTLSNKNVDALKDENYYQLIKYTGEAKVIGPDGVWFYDVGHNATDNKAFIGSTAVQASGKKVKINGEEYIEIYAERNFSMNSSAFNGTYKWDYLGYVKEDNIKYINKGKTGFKESDVNFDDVIDMKDLSLVAELFNVKKGNSRWNNNCDLNGDGIIDIYDIVRVANKING